MKRIKEPFGFRVPSPLDDEKFIDFRKIYYRKVLLFSIPFSIALIISNMYILNPTLGAFLLSLLTFGLGGVTFFFFIQGYMSVKSIYIQKSIADEIESQTIIEENNLEKW